MFYCRGTGPTWSRRRWYPRNLRPREVLARHIQFLPNALVESVGRFHVCIPAISPSFCIRIKPSSGNPLKFVCCVIQCTGCAKRLCISEQSDCFVGCRATHFSLIKEGHSLLFIYSGRSFMQTKDRRNLTRYNDQTLNIIGITSVVLKFPVGPLPGKLPSITGTII